MKARVALLLWAVILLPGALLALHAWRVVLLYRPALEAMHPGGTTWLVVGLGLAALVAVAAATRLVVRALDGGARSWGFMRWRMALVALVGGYVGVVAALAPFERLYLELALGLAAGAAALLFLLLEAGGGRPLRPRLLFKVLDFGLFQAALLFLVLEVGLRLAGTLFPHPLWVVGNPGEGELLAMARFEPGRAYMGSVCNEAGFHDGPLPPRTEGRRLVASIADSFGVGIVPHPFHYTTVCEDELGDTDVYNMGVVSVGLREYLQLLRQEALVLGPDAVVVSIFVGNDLAARGFGRPSHPRLRAWFDPQVVRSFVITDRVRKVLRGWEGQAGETLAAEGLIDIETARAEFPWVEDWSLEQPPMTEEAFMDCEVMRATDVCVDGAAPFERVFGLMDDMVRSAGSTPVVFLILPDEFQVEDELWEAVLARVDRPEAYERFLPQQRLRAEAEERGWRLVDLLKRFRAVEPKADGWRHLYHARDTHFNAAGNRLAGKALASALRELWEEQADGR